MIEQEDYYDIPNKSGNILQLGNVIGASYALECANISKRHNGLVLIITSDSYTAKCLVNQISQFTSLPIRFFIDWETLPYDSLSPHSNIISKRISTLYQLPKMQNGMLILPVHTLMQKICPYNFLYKKTLIIRKGQKLLLDQLNEAGYQHVNQVMEHGQYTIKSSLLDIFPMGSKEPFRISLFNNTITMINSFNVNNQRTTIKSISKIILLPTHEFPIDKSGIEIFRNKYYESININNHIDYFYQQISSGVLPAGIQYWQPFFFKEPLCTLFNLLPNNTLLQYYGNLENTAKLFWDDINLRYKYRSVNSIRPLVNPKLLWLFPDELINELKKWPRIKITSNKLPVKINNVNLNYKSLPDLNITHHDKTPLEKLHKFLKQFNGIIIFSVMNENRCKSFLKILKNIKLYPQFINSFKELDNKSCTLMIGCNEHGFINTKDNLAFICENDLFGDRINYQHKSNFNIINPYTIINNLTELCVGQPIVHLEHGVGRYIGLTTIETAGIKAEYVILSYADNAKLYVPVSSLHLINYYTSGKYENAPLHKLGKDTWVRTREKSIKKIQDIAVKLLDIYAQRASKIGFSFKTDYIEYQLFCESFPFEMTIDQTKAINEVLSDMSKPLTMDRLICGEVGFGKTEVAIRAAFIAVKNNKQVIILVPNTLLAQQHYNNFIYRFSNWHINIEMLSRFRTSKEQTTIITLAEKGKINILIATHKLLLTKLRWYNLGLLIIDEEHKFGVLHKEKIKTIYSNIDILTLTATPIPRTLNMAMCGIRDISIIATPPARRLTVKTFVQEFNNSVIREAISREILRGGQVYYLYNDVKNINKIRLNLIKLVPEARIVIAHGKMPKRDLEKIMNDFYHQRFNVLVCTTIIETGIDIPTANTILIERADNFGLAQLHQLRGRVGRSYHQAYAWLLTPNPKTMQTSTKKRLDAIASSEDFGAGFALATYDLEIRGAGDLLGEEQSGQIKTLGFSLYMTLLDNAINSLKKGKEQSLENLINSYKTDIELSIPAILSEDLIPDTNIRLSLYKRIASALNENELYDLREELIDRFGILPIATCNLIDIAILRLKAQELGIRKIKINNNGEGFFEFTTQNKINISWLVKLLQKEPDKWKLDTNTKLTFIHNLSNSNDRISLIRDFISKAAEN